MKKLYQAYKNEAVMLLVYIREAHPARVQQTAEDAGWKVIEGMVFHQPKTFQERRKLAETACTFWELPIPALVDVMEPDVGGMYQAWPTRLYLLDTEGKIVFRGAKGPRGVDVHEGELQLRKLLGMTEGKLATQPHRLPGKTAGRGRLGSRPGTPGREAQKPAEEPKQGSAKK